MGEESIKLYIEDLPHPWLTWDKDLWILQESKKSSPECNVSFYNIELTTSPWNADVFFINRDAVNIRDKIFKNKRVFLFIDTIGPDPQHEIQCVQDVTYANDNNWILVTESLSAYDKLNSIGLKNDPWLWRRPSRINAKRMFNEVPLDKRECKITAVFDVGYPLSHVADLVKAYLSSFIILRDDYNIEPILQIFSAAELPFEPFNEISFEGFKSNKIVHDEVSKSQLFIYPSEKETYPNTMIEAVQLGVPCLQYLPKNTTLKLHKPFNDMSHIYWHDTEELSRKIIDHFVKIEDDKDYMNDRIVELKSIVMDEDTEFDLNMFLTEVTRRINEKI